MSLQPEIRPYTPLDNERQAKQGSSLDDFISLKIDPVNPRAKADVFSPYEAGRIPLGQDQAPLAPLSEQHEAQVDHSSKSRASGPRFFNRPLGRPLSAVLEQRSIASLQTKQSSDLQCQRPYSEPSKIKLCPSDSSVIVGSFEQLRPARWGRKVSGHLPLASRSDEHTNGSIRVLKAANCGIEKRSNDRQISHGSKSAEWSIFYPESDPLDPETAYSDGSGAMPTQKLSKPI